MIVLKRHLTPDRKSLPLEGKVQEQLLPVLSTGDRRAFLHARWSPFLPESIWQTERRQRAGTAQIYLDVSGSMSAEMPELIALLPKLRRLSPSSHFVFVSKEGAPLSVDSIQFIVRRAGERAGLPFRMHPHMLRHACGHYLINTAGGGKGTNTRTVQEYLGHVAIKSTERYTEWTPSGSGTSGSKRESTRGSPHASHIDRRPM